MTVSAAVRPEKFDLGDGLIMRWSTSADKNDIADLMAEAFRSRPLNRTIPKGYEPLPNDFIHAGVKRVMSGHSAVMDPTDFAVVENTRAKEGELKLVAGMSLQRLPGYYGKTNLQFGVGEIVGSVPQFRNRGLIRRLFLDMIHPASDARGDLIQIIPGISHFYLQFGYIHSLKGRDNFIFSDYNFIPKLADGEEEPFTLRTPKRADIPYLVKMSARETLNCPAYDVGFHYDESYWLYTAFEVHEKSESYQDGDRMSRIVVDAKTGQDVGLVIFSAGVGFAWELFTLNEDPANGVTYRETMYPILRQIVAEAKERWNAPIAKIREELKEQIAEDEKRRKESEDPAVKFAPVLHPLLELKSDRIGDSFNILLHPTHPVRQLLDKKGGKVYPAFRFYTRIKSYSKFLTKVAPTLEDRLAKSCMAGITANVLFNFYRVQEGASAKGLKLQFVKGKLVCAEDWSQPSDIEQMEKDRAEVLEAEKKAKKAATNSNGTNAPVEGQDEEEVKPVEYKAMFPPLVFTRLVMGEVPFEQLKIAYEDAYAIGDDCKMLLRILFPVVDHNSDTFWW